MDPLDEVIARVDQITKQVEAIMQLLRIEHIAEETTPDA